MRRPATSVSFVSSNAERRPKIDAAATSPRSVRVDLGAIVAHPLRAKALDVLAQRTASPTEIAQELNAPDVSKVAYHVRKLLEVGAIELVDERKVRGAVEHFYRARVLPYLTEEEFASLTIDQRKAFTTYIIQLGLASITRSIDAGTFDARPERYLTRLPCLVDETGWRELAELHGELYERTMRIREESANRIAGDPEQPVIKATQLAMFFEEP
jgi:DNA-binding transcriptional ArsR family regulator